jgi:voltage-dependent potassium channel beta subunit
MEYRFLGSSGLQVSSLSFGAWVTFANQLDDELALECMQTAIDKGVNFFDNAEAYARGEAETIMGRVVKKGGWKRKDLVISTKIFWGGEGPNDSGLSRKHILEGTEAALARLQMEYVDLIFCHRPDYHTPIEETVRAMSYLVNRGKTFYWGTSEWSAEEIRTAHEIARREHLVPPTMEQPQYNMFHRDRVELEYKRLYEDIGLGTTTWSPLASGILTGKYNDGIPQDTRLTIDTYSFLRELVESEEGKSNLKKVRKLAPIAEGLDCSLAQLALAWCLRNRDVSTVITGASRPEQISENLKALDLVDRLTPEVLDRIERVLQNKPVPPQDWRAL